MIQISLKCSIATCGWWPPNWRKRLFLSIVASLGVGRRSRLWDLPSRKQNKQPWQRKPSFGVTSLMLASTLLLCSLLEQKLKTLAWSRSVLWSVVAVRPPCVPPAISTFTAPGKLPLSASPSCFQIQRPPSWFYSCFPSLLRCLIELFILLSASKC